MYFYAPLYHITAKGEMPVAEYIPFSEEQKIRANGVDIVDFLRYQGATTASPSKATHGTSTAPSAAATP